MYVCWGKKDFECQLSVTAVAKELRVSICGTCSLLPDSRSLTAYYVPTERCSSTEQGTQSDASMHPCQLLASDKAFVSLYHICTERFLSPAGLPSLACFVNSDIAAWQLKSQKEIPCIWLRGNRAMTDNEGIKNGRQKRAGRSWIFLIRGSKSRVSVLAPQDSDQKTFSVTRSNDSLIRVLWYKTFWTHRIHSFIHSSNVFFLSFFSSNASCPLLYPLPLLLRLPHLIDRW